ncbi:SpoIIE family protein phosphatase [Streptomyces lusitanus]|uniref:PAS domain-containing protein n=1 Tax=Streptomyces lusitanus TaxID=68232 RepID=A0ABU3JYM6_9ACTN|nr:PAS domain-containing protein [Streptomyces lusitanus]
MSTTHDGSETLTRRPSTAELTVDQQGLIARWSEAARALLGFTASEIRGEPVTRLLSSRGDASDGGTAGAAPVLVHGSDGHTRACRIRVRPADDVPGGWVVAVTPVVAGEPGDGVGSAVLETLFTQAPSSLCVYDSDLRLRRFNPAAHGMQGVFGPRSLGLMPHEVWPDSNSEEFEVRMRQVLESGVPVMNFDKRGRPPDDPEHEHVFANSVFRLEDDDGRVLGLATTAVEITEQRIAEERIALLADTGSVIGTSLSVVETGRQLADVTVPRFADAATVDVYAPVLAGEEPGPDRCDLRRVGVRYRGDDAAPGDSRRRRRPRFPYPTAPGEHVGDAPYRCEVVLPADDGEPLYPSTGGSRPVACLVAPMTAREGVVGIVTFYRLRPGGSFSAFDSLTARDLASRTALAIDNARRYLRERNTARTLQRRLLRRRTAEQSAVTTSHYFAPASAGAHWFDVIPVSGARVAFVLAETTETGLSGAASVGRLGAAVHTLASLDLAPEEVLARLDTLVTQMAGSGDGVSPHDDDAAVAEIRCVYGVYDPAPGRLSLAVAGHVPPAVAEPGGTVRTPSVPVGKALGTDERHFSGADVDLPDGSVIAFCTPALAPSTSARDGQAPAWLTGPLASATGRPLDDLRDTILASFPGLGRTPGGAVLLLARTHRLGDDQVHTWDLPSDPAIVATARSLVQRQLAVWGLEETGFVTELVVSELVTNAIRYAQGPIRLRVIRDHETLICEVSDASTTAPHLRYARTGDEGGRGLFLVAQLTQRWGTRFSDTGKTIWTEQDTQTSA